MTNKVKKTIVTGLLAGLLGTGFGCSGNINCNYPGKTPVKKIQKTNLPQFYFCNRWEDNNPNDGIVQDREIVGLKNRFNVNEPIAIAGRFRNKQGQTFTMKLFNGSNKLVDKIEKPIKFDNASNFVNYSSGQIYKLGGEGTYTAKWYIDGEFIGEKNFDLIKWK